MRTTLKSALFPLLLFIFSLQAYGQGKQQLRISTGIVEDARGYFISAGFGIPIGKAFELTPTLTYMNTLGTDFSSISYYKSSTGSSTGISTPNAPGDQSRHGFMGGAIDINLIFKPLSLGNKATKHEPYIGIGFGFKHYIQYTSWLVEVAPNNHDLASLSTKINSNIALNPVILGYNYQISDKVSLGVHASLNGIDGEPVTLIGLQTAVKL